MTWWQTLLVAVVPSALTAFALIAQQRAQTDANGRTAARDRVTALAAARMEGVTALLEEGVLVLATASSEIAPAFERVQVAVSAPPRVRVRLARRTPAFPLPAAVAVHARMLLHASQALADRFWEAVLATERVSVLVARVTSDQRRRRVPDPAAVSALEEALAAAQRARAEFADAAQGELVRWIKPVAAIPKRRRFRPRRAW